VEVKRAETTLEALLRSDEDMAALYLSHRKQRGEARPEKECGDGAAAARAGPPLQLPRISPL